MVYRPVPQRIHERRSAFQTLDGRRQFLRGVRKQTIRLLSRLGEAAKSDSYILSRLEKIAGGTVPQSRQGPSGEDHDPRA